ncbi:MAG: hypothetical protein J3R72DRAFT_447215 [Linnemannia gamsii]|nr:MAG: hypothetical protein J3R72DRAFT_447215 [Linnemannia gamsii]
MLAIKNFRPLFLVAVVTAFMVLTITSVEAAPADIKAPNCVECDNPPFPICRNGSGCSRGYYCEINWCTCVPQCYKGPQP